MVGKLTDELRTNLKNEVGEENFSEDFVEIPSIHLQTYADVSSNREMMKNRKFVVRPDSVDSVCNIVRIANERRIPIIPLGGASSFYTTGGAVPTEQESLVIDARRMNRVVNLDRKSNAITVEAGVTIEQLNMFLRGYGLWYPHQPESYNTSTVVGAISLNGISPFATKYGQPRGLVVAMKVVLSDGRVYNIGNKTIFDNLFKLKDIFVGSEGSLGVIVEVTLKVYPIPETRLKRLFGFSHTIDACIAVRQIAASGLYPEIVMIPSKERIYNEALLPILSSLDVSKILESRESFVFITLGGSEDLGKFQMSKMSDIMARNGGSPVDDLVAESYWRNLTEFGAVVTPQMARAYKGQKYNSLRGGVPLEFLAEFIAAEKRAFSPANRLIDDGVTAYVFLPALDVIAVCGVLLDDNDERSVSDFNEWLCNVCGLYKGFGGTLSACAGVGTLLRKHLDLELGDSKAIMNQIKEALDPIRLMNPGKIFEAGHIPG